MASVTASQTNLDSLLEDVAELERTLATAKEDVLDAFKEAEFLCDRVKDAIEELTA